MNLFNSSTEVKGVAHLKKKQKKKLLLVPYEVHYMEKILECFNQKP